jgi:hypothetical protein
VTVDIAAVFVGEEEPAIAASTPNGSKASNPHNNDKAIRYNAVAALSEARRANKQWKIEYARRSLKILTASLRASVITGSG